MKKQLTSMDIRVIRVPSPQKEEIQNKIKQARKIEHTQLAKMHFPDIYTR